MPHNIKLQYPINTLVSYHYFKKIDLTPAIENKMYMVADSGAFSALTQGAEIDIDEFGQWAVKWKDNLAWIASLDVIGNASGSWDNFNYLRSNYSLDVIPTIHFGCDPSELDRYAALGIDFVCLGGMVAHSANPNKLLRWALKVFKYAHKHYPTMRFHGLGITHKDLLFNLPWYSVDSSGWFSGQKFGRVRLWSPNIGDFVNFDLDGKAIFNYSSLIRDHYGIEPALVSTSSAANSDYIVRLGARSSQLLEEHLRKRNKISKPTYGISPNAPDGINIHLVANPTHLGRNLRPLQEEVSQ